MSELVERIRAVGTITDECVLDAIAKTPRDQVKAIWGLCERGFDNTHSSTIFHRVLADELAQNIPDSLKRESRWVMYDQDYINGVWGHYYLTPKRQIASPTDPETWVSFEEIYRRVANCNCHGVGFALGDGFLGIDIEECIDDSSRVSPLASSILRALPSFSEVSRDLYGIHIVGRGSFPRGTIPGCWWSSDLGIKVYEGNKFFNMTGLALRDGARLRYRLSFLVTRMIIEGLPMPWRVSEFSNADLSWLWAKVHGA